MLALIVLLAAVSLVLPFVLRVSRMMWIAVFAGLATALLSAAIAVAVDVDGPVSGSMLPGTTYAMMGLLACICMMSGGAVRRFVMLRQHEKTGAVEIEGRGSKAVSIASHVGRAVLVCLLAVSVVACAGFNYVECDHSQVKTSDAGLPMVATDFLGQDDARRVLALRADSAESVSYSVMRTGRGDLIDSSPAQRVEVVSGRSDGSSRTIAQDCASCWPMPIPMPSTSLASWVSAAFTLSSRTATKRSERPRTSSIRTLEPPTGHRMSSVWIMARIIV